MSAQEIPVMSLEDFLEWETKQGTRHEFIDGIIFRMAQVCHNNV